MRKNTRKIRWSGVFSFIRRFVVVVIVVFHGLNFHLSRFPNVYLSTRQRLPMLCLQQLICPSGCLSSFLTCLSVYYLSTVYYLSICLSSPLLFFSHSPSYIDHWTQFSYHCPAFYHVECRIIDLIIHRGTNKHANNAGFQIKWWVLLLAKIENQQLVGQVTQRQFCRKTSPSTSGPTARHGQWVVLTPLAGRCSWPARQVACLSAIDGPSANRK